MKQHIDKIQFDELSEEDKTKILGKSECKCVSNKRLTLSVGEMIEFLGKKDKDGNIIYKGITIDADDLLSEVKNKLKTNF